MLSGVGGGPQEQIERSVKLITINITVEGKTLRSQTVIEHVDTRFLQICPLLIKMYSKRDYQSMITNQITYSKSAPRVCLEKLMLLEEVTNCIVDDNGLPEINKLVESSSSHSKTQLMRDDSLLDKHPYEPYLVGFDYYCAISEELAEPNLADCIMATLWCDNQGQPADTWCKLKRGHTPVSGILHFEDAWECKRTGAIVGRKACYHRALTPKQKALNSLREASPEDYESLELDDEDIIEPTTYQYFVECKGSYFETQDILNSFELIRYFSLLDWHCTRCDLKIDIPYSAPLWERFKYWHENKLFTNFRTRSNSGSESQALPGTYLETLYFGSRNSGSMLRIYRTIDKHGFDAIRVELESKQDKAQATIEEILKVATHADSANMLSEYESIAIKHNLQGVMANILLGCTDMCSKLIKGNKTIKEKVVDPVWEELREHCLAHEPMKIKLPTESTSVFQKLNFVIRQCPKSLSIVYDGLNEIVPGLGPQFLKDVIDRGRDTRGPEGEALVNACKTLSLSTVGRLSKIMSKEIAPCCQKLVEKAKGCTPSKHRIDRPPSTRERKIQRMFRQGARTLAMNRDRLGKKRLRESLNTAYREGLSRFNDEHNAMMAVLRNHKAIYERLLEELD